MTTVSTWKSLVLVPPVLRISKALPSPYVRNVEKAMCESYRPFIFLSSERSRDPTVGVFLVNREEGTFGGFQNRIPEFPH